MADTQKDSVSSQALLVSRHSSSQSKEVHWPWPVKLLLCLIVLLGCVLTGLTVLVILTAKHSTNFHPSLTTRHSDEDDAHSLCDPFPQLNSVPLPEQCQITYSNGHTVNASSYTYGQCSNCLCVPPYWARSVDTRYCCLPANTANITYSCPHYLDGEVITVSNVPIECTCQPCVQLVTFVVQVLTEDLEPVILANVIVNDLSSYQTDNKGYIGFTVPASQSSVHLHIQAVGYQETEEDYFVLPGQINSHTLTLALLNYKTFIPPQTPFLLKLNGLAVHPLPQNFSFEMLTSAQFLPNLLNDGLNYGESFAYFPANFFPPNQLFTFFSSHGDQYLNNFKASFTVNHNRDKLSYRTPLYAIISGRLDIQDENGAPFISITNEEDPSKRYGVLAVLANELYHSLHKPHLFTFNIGSKHFEQLSKETILVPINRDSAHLHLFTPHSVTFPQTYLIAVQESTSCYIAVSSRDMNGLIQTKQDKKSTIVKATSNIWYTENDWMSSISYGRIDSCLIVPCKGELTLNVLGFAEGDGDQHGLQLNNLEMELLQVNEEISKVFHSKQECESSRATSTVGLSLRSIQVDLIPDYCIEPQPLASYFNVPLQSQLSMDDHQDISYCSVRVAVSIPPFTSAIVTATTSHNELKTERMDSIGDGVVEPITEPNEVDFASGIMSGSGAFVADEAPAKTRVHYRCFTFPCTSKVTLTARIQSNTLNDAHHLANDLHYLNDYFKQVINRGGSRKDSEIGVDTHSTCFPYSAPPLPSLPHTHSESVVHFLVNLAPPQTGEFTYRASRDHFGVYMSSGVPQISWGKCSRSENAGIQFHCPKL